MDPLTIGAIAVAATKTGRFLKSLGSRFRPASKPQDFSSVLERKLQETPAAPKDIGADLERCAERRSTLYIRLLDADGNGSLSLHESGMTEKQFAALDRDGNGDLSAQELRQVVLDSLNRRYNQAVGQE